MVVVSYITIFWDVKVTFDSYIAVDLIKEKDLMSLWVDWVSDISSV